MHGGRGHRHRRLHIDSDEPNATIIANRERVARLSEMPTPPLEILPPDSMSRARRTLKKASIIGRLHRDDLHVPMTLSNPEQGFGVKRLLARVDAGCS